MISYFIKRDIKANLRLSKRQRYFENFENINNILILFEISDYEETVEILYESFENIDKKVNLFAFANQKEVKSPSEKIQFYSKKELNFLGYPNIQVSDKFQKLDSESDLLIDLSFDNHLSLSYLSSKSNVKLKVGISGSGAGLHDFVVNVPKNVDGKFLSQQIMFYLRKLKSQRSRVVL